MTPKTSILWVDDNVEQFGPTLDRLKTANFNVTTASSFQKALRKIERRSFDLILTDLTFSDESRNFIRRAKERSPKTFIVIVSAYENSPGGSNPLLKSTDYNFFVNKSNLSPEANTGSVGEEFIKHLQELSQDRVRSSSPIVAAPLEPIDANPMELRLRFMEGNNPELICKIDTGSAESFVSYEWLVENNLYKKFLGGMVIAVGGEPMNGARMTKECVLISPRGDTRTVNFTFIATKNWPAFSNANGKQTKAFAIIGRRFIAENKLSVEIDLTEKQGKPHTLQNEPFDLLNRPSPIIKKSATVSPKSGTRAGTGVFRRSRTKIGRSVLRNNAEIALSTAALLALIEEKLASLRAQLPNSEEAKRGRDEEISRYVLLGQQLDEFRIAAQKYISGMEMESAAVDSAKSFSDGVRTWWTKSHHQICDRAFDMGLFISAVTICTLAGAGGPLSVAVSGAMVGGKPVVEALKSIGKSFLKSAGNSD